MLGVQAAATQLRDGTRVTLRPIEPEDRQALLAGFDRLSPESRYRRFFSPMPRLSDRHLDYLTQVDHRDHEALVAIDRDSGDVVGVARFVRTAADEAEPAIVVADDWQGRGLGTTLVDRLADRAREERIERFRAPVLAGNAAAIELLSGLGHTVRRHAGNEVELLIELAPEPTAADRLRSMLRVAAQGLVRPGLTMAQRLGWRARAAATDRGSLADAVVVLAPRDPAEQETLDQAADLAATLGASVELVAPRVRTAEEAPHAAEAVDALRGRGVDVHVHARRDDPATALVDVASECLARLIVVERSGRGGVPRLLPGDVADAVVATAPCDVLIVRGADD
jgi:RimJ/RimL family protein N-acetyltransferase